MASRDDEDRQLRSVAMQNVQSIRQARQRAEEELIRAKEALAEQARELADFFENASIGLHWVGPDGVSLRVNQAELNLLGYAREEVVGRHIADFHVDQDVIADMLNRLRAGETIRDYPARLRCKDGSIKHVLIDSSVFWRDGKFVHTRCFTRDITDRQRVEEAQAQLAAIVESSQDAIVAKTLDSRILSWNAGAERLFGYAAEEAIGQTINMIIPPDRQQEEQMILERLRRGERIESYETVRVSKQGRLIDVSLTISPVRDGAGRIVGASKIARDITANKRAEQALRDSERRFRLMAETIPSIIWTAAPDGTITYANERWFEYCGLTPEQNARRWPELVLHPDDHARCVAAWTRALQEGTEYEIEVRNRRHDGAYRWFVTRAVPLRDAGGNVVQWFGTTSDIDDRKRAEQIERFLADASAHLAHLTDYESTLQRLAALAVPAFADWCAVDMVDSDGAIRRLAVTHTDPAKVRLAHELLRRYPPQPSDAFGVMHVFRTGETEWAAEIPDAALVAAARDEEHLRIIRQLGLRSYICTPLRSRTKTLGVLTFAMAESHRVYDAVDLAAAEDLALRAGIAIDNANLLGALKDADRLKDEFLAMLAHELRNPLAPIQSAVEFLRTPPLTGPNQQAARDVIERQLRHLVRLVDDLLDVARISRGKIILQKERISIAAAVDLALETSRPNIEANRHKLTVSQPPEPVVVDADPTRLAQIIANLLNNASKYTPPGGSIHLTVESQDGEAVVRVRDNGVGIPAAMLTKVFDLFAQVESSRERASGGLGLGLTLVRRLLEMHGGTIEAQSAGLNQGSEFIVRLPLAAAPLAAVPAAVPPAPQFQAVPIHSVRAPAPQRILLVDDNVDAVNLLARLLRMDDHEVKTAHDGLEAYDTAAVFQPDVALIDIGLPKLNGHELARKIREQPWGKTMLLVAVTGWAQAEDVRRSREVGFDHHLVKPVKSAVLADLLAERTNGGRA